MTDSARARPRLNRRDVIGGAAAAVLTASLPGKAGSETRARPPNVLFILADDFGYADLSCYGRRDYRTPVIDGLAAGGLLMTQAYANSAICSPTRVALITGRYHQRLAVGLPEPIAGGERSLGLPPDHVTLPGMLRAAGYRTSIVGKWHMGWPPEHGPLRSGYDSFFGIAPGAADYFTHLGYRPDAPGNREHAMFEGDTPIERQGYLTDLLAERAAAEIREGLARSQPFLVSLHFTAPHWPWQGPGDAGSSAAIDNLRHQDGGSLEKFAEMVVAMDTAIGRVLAELDNAGQAANTIVIFTSDNGGERFSDTWPLRGGKGELLEGGIRVPAIVRWPERIPRGTRSEQVAATMDWLPTLVAAAGAATDPAYPPDGENLLPVLTGVEPPRSRKIFWRFRNKDQAAVRDGPWKFFRIEGEESLFDIVRDPRERANLKDRQAEIFARLRDEHAAWNADMLPYPPAAGAGPAPGGNTPAEADSRPTQPLPPPS